MAGCLNHGEETGRRSWALSSWDYMHTITWGTLAYSACSVLRTMERLPCHHVDNLECKLVRQI